VDTGVERANDAAESIRRIESRSHDTASNVGEITEAIAQQSAAATSIAQQLERIAQATEENHAAATSTSEAANHLTDLSASMDSVVRGYHV
jgi:methyl-accepting chemotaxis protein